MKKIYFISLLLLSCFEGFSQVARPSFGFGIIGGYKSSYSSGGIMAEYLFLNHLDVNAGLANHKYQGAGYSFGSKYYPFGIKVIAPVISLNYVSFTGIKFSLMDQQGMLADYRTPHADYLIPGVGLTYNENQLSLLLAMNYSYSFKQIHVANETGVPDVNFMNSLDKKINGGVGVTIAIVFHPWGKPYVKKSSD